MRKPQSQISQFLWKLSEDFCPRIIGIDGRIQWVSMIVPSHFIVNKLWLPSGIKLISLKSVSENESLKSVVIENMSKLEGIESEAFQRTILNFLAIPNSVGFLGSKCFCCRRSLSPNRFESESRLSRIEKGAFWGTGLAFLLFFWQHRMILWLILLSPEIGRRVAIGMDHMRSRNLGIC
jgi:hypothetical protein